MKHMLLKFSWHKNCIYINKKMVVFLFLKDGDKMQGTELSVHRNVRMSSKAGSALGAWQAIVIRKAQEEWDVPLEGRYKA